MLNRLLNIERQGRINSSNVFNVQGNSYLISAGFFLLSSFASYSMTVTPATVTVSNPDAALLRGYALEVGGSYSCTTQDAALLKTSILSVSPAPYNVTVNDAALIKIFAIAIDTATVAVTFNDFSVSRGYIMPFRISYTVTGSELRGGIQLTKPATVVNEASTTADVVTEKTLSSTITTQVVL